MCVAEATPVASFIVARYQRILLRSCWDGTMNWARGWASQYRLISYDLRRLNKWNDTTLFNWSPFIAAPRRFTTAASIIDGALAPMFLFLSERLDLQLLWFTDCCLVCLIVNYNSQSSPRLESNCHWSMTNERIDGWGGSRFLYQQMER